MSFPRSGRSGSVALALVVTLTVAWAPVVAQADDGPPTCGGYAATIVGTEGDDVLVGTNKRDVVVGLGGDDRIVGGNGDDVLCGGDGDDTISGGNGDDTVYGGLGDDRASGDNGDDALDLGAGDDRADGGNGDDVLELGAGTDAAVGGRGQDTCGGAETTDGCETVVEPVEELTETLTVSQSCTADLALSAATPDDVVSEGDVVRYDITVRNDPVGSCLGDPATVAGSLSITSTLPVDTTVVSRAVWLETAGAEGTAGRTVLPAAAGLTSDGAAAPAGCPGGTVEGCGAQVGDTVGNVSYPDGDSLVVPAGATVDVPFRYFPTLAPEDVATIGAGDVVVALAVGYASGETTIVRAPVTFAPPPASGPVTVAAQLPTGTAEQVLPDVPAGEETTVEALFTYPVGPDDRDQLTSSFVATAGPVTSTEQTVTSTVVVDPDTLPRLQPAIWPTAATAGEPTGFVVSAAPTGAVTGAVTVTWTDGAATMVDDGTGADLVADDGVWTAEFVWGPTGTGPTEVEVTATVDDAAESGVALVEVLPAGVPATAEALPDLDVVTDGGSTFLTDRLVVVAADGATAADIQAAAATVSGTVVGTSGPGVWQVAVAPVADRAALDALLARISQSPAVVGAQPSFTGELDAVEPSDPRFADQTNITRFGLDDAWVFQRGTSRSVVVAVIDSGVNLDHPDLAGALLEGTDIRNGDDDPNDDLCLHGTHVAGIVGARTDNGVGVAGVNWGSRVLPVKVFNPTSAGCGQFRYDDIAAAIDYSVAQGATVLNMSLSGPDRSEDVARALDRALAANRLTVATAGNTGERERRYPSGFERSERYTSWFGLNARTYSIDVLSVGNMTDDRTRADSSTFGPWVDIVAPGEEVLSTFSDATPYQRLSGTSMAAPYVAGVLSLMRAEDPSMTPGRARYRLQATGLPLEDEFGPTLRPYEAVVNGSFEAGFDPWQSTGTVASVLRVGPVTPRDGERMLSLSSGPAAAQTQATLRRSIDVPAGALTDDTLTISLRYNYLSEEYPEFVNAGFNDTFVVDLLLPDGSRERLVDESVDTTAWTPVTGIDFPGGDSTVGQSGWRSVQTTIPASRLVGRSSFEMVVADRGDAVYDSVGLIDRIRVG